jgi:hypothetical protein
MNQKAEILQIFVNPRRKSNEWNHENVNPLTPSHSLIGNLLIEIAEGIQDSNPIPSLGRLCRELPSRSVLRTVPAHDWFSIISKAISPAFSTPYFPFHLGSDSFQTRTAIAESLPFVSNSVKLPPTSLNQAANWLFHNCSAEFATRPVELQIQILHLKPLIPTPIFHFFCAHDLEKCAAASRK